MASGTVFDDGTRFSASIFVRVPPELRERVQAAADKEGLRPAEFARRALAERAMRTASERRHSSEGTGR